MPALLIDQQVADFEAWLEHFEAHGPRRAAAGVSASTVWQAADDPCHVYILHRHPDAAALLAFTQSPDLLARLHATGVTGTPAFHHLGDGREFEH